MRSRPSKKRIIALTLALSLSSPRPASASVFGEENGLLSSILATELAQALDIANTLSYIVKFVKATNEVLSFTRQAYRIYQQVRSYTPKKLLEDAKRGLYKAIPEAEQLDREIRASIENGKALVQGEEAFFGHSDHHEPWAKGMSQSLFRTGYRGLAKYVIRGGTKLYSDKPTMADKLIAKRFQESKMLSRQLYEKSAFGVLANKVTTLVDDAEKKNRADLKAQALSAQLQLDSAASLSQIKDYQKLSTALKESQRHKERAFSKGLEKSLQRVSGQLFHPTWARGEVR